jgi:hypothetical protein
LRAARASAPDKPAPDSPVFALPTRDGSAYGVSESDLAGWQAAFHGTDVLAELRKMSAWLEANPSRGKTARGIPRFVVAWLAREHGSEAPQRSNGHAGSRSPGRWAGGDVPRGANRPDAACVWLERARDAEHAKAMHADAVKLAARLERMYGRVGWFYDCAHEALKHWRAEAERFAQVAAP